MKEIIFFILPFWIFTDFDRKVIQTFGQKTSRSLKNYLLRVQRNSLWLEILRHGSQNSIYVSRVEFAKEIFFLFFLSEFFRILSEKFPDFWPKNVKTLSKLPSTCPEEQFVAWIFFQTLNRFRFSAETIAMVLKFLSTSPD